MRGGCGGCEGSNAWLLSWLQNLIRTRFLKEIFRDVMKYFLPRNI